METRNQKLIRFGRAISKAIPKTMTPWEWEEWYGMYGKPDHFKTDDESAS